MEIKIRNLLVYNTLLHINDHALFRVSEKIKEPHSSKCCVCVNTNCTGRLYVFYYEETPGVAQEIKSVCGLCFNKLHMLAKNIDV